MKPRPQEDNTHAVEIIQDAWCDMLPKDNRHGLDILSSIYLHLTSGSDPECYDSVANWVIDGEPGVAR